MDGGARSRQNDGGADGGAARMEPGEAGASSARVPRQPSRSPSRSGDAEHEGAGNARTIPTRELRGAEASRGANRGRLARSLPRLRPASSTSVVRGSCLVATILSAQCTDRMVNQVTPALFEQFPDAQSLARAPQSKIERLIRKTGFYSQKAKAIRATAKVSSIASEAAFRDDRGPHFLARSRPQDGKCCARHCVREAGCIRRYSRQAPVIPARAHSLRRAR